MKLLSGINFSSSVLLSLLWLQNMLETCGFVINILSVNKKIQFEKLKRWMIYQKTLYDSQIQVQKLKNLVFVIAVYRLWIMNLNTLLKQTLDELRKQYYRNINPK